MLRGVKTNDIEAALAVEEYAFCKIFKVTPTEYEKTDIEKVRNLIKIHEIVKKIEKEEMDKEARKRKMNSGRRH